MNWWCVFNIYSNIGKSRIYERKIDGRIEFSYEVLSGKDPLGYLNDKNLKLYIGKNKWFSDEKWLEKLIRPLIDDDKIITSVSDLLLPEWYWKKYPFFTRILCLNEREVRRPVMDARACAYRKKDLEKIGFFNEDPKVIGIDSDLYLKLIALGKIAYPGCVVYHLHPLTNKQKIKLTYNYGVGNGKLVRKYDMKIHGFWRRILRAIPLIGLFSIGYNFPYRKYFHYFL